MSGLNFEQMSDSKPVYERKEGVLVYPPTGKQEPLTVTLLGDPINQSPSTKQSEEGLEPGWLMYRWSSFQNVDITNKTDPFTNSKGREVKPKSTPTLIALHSEDENGEPIFLEKPLERVKSALLYETHRDPGYFLMRNPQFFPKNYTDDFKAGWNIKPALALRVFLHDKVTNLPIEEEKILVIDGGYYTPTIQVLKEGAIENDLDKTGGYAFRRMTFSRVPDGSKTKANVVAKSSGVPLYEQSGYEHLKGYKYQLSFNMGDDRVFNIDTFDAQREYLMDNYNIVIPSSADILADNGKKWSK